MADAPPIDPVIRRPAHALELGELVRGAAAEGRGLYPRGGGTHSDIGLVPTKPGTIIDMTAMNAVVDYPARDMTVTLQAGATLAQLAALLKAEKQWLPIDVPNPDAATVGGSLATNSNGPRRLTQGTWRDAVLGIRFVTDEGVEVKGGGRVVKNVAGYDLMKLHAGALGTLGIITEVTLKVKPIPETSAFVVFGVPASAVAPTLDRIHASLSRPVAVELLNRAAVKSLGIGLPDAEPWLIACGFEEKAATVAWQIETLTAECAGTPLRDLTVIRDAEAAKLWSGLTALQSGRDGSSTLKFNTRPSALAALALKADAAHSQAVVHCHAGNGIAFAHLPNEPKPDRLSTVLGELLGTAAHENVQILRCPRDWKAVLPVWGLDRGDRALMGRIRATLDPRGLFNPGRVPW